VRNISFALTTAQVRARTKTVTRRRGTWWSKVLKPGDLLCAVEKSQGIKRGGLVRLGTIRVASVRVELLSRIFDNVAATPDYGASGLLETAREGFPEMTGMEFARMFVAHMGGVYAQLVTRIEFEYVEETVPLSSGCGSGE
jgi:hypothetical protein